MVPKPAEAKAVFLFSAQCCFGRRGPSYSGAAEDENHVPLPEDAERCEAEREGSEAVSGWQSRCTRGQRDPKDSWWENSR